MLKLCKLFNFITHQNACKIMPKSPTLTPFRHAIYDLPISLWLSFCVLVVFFASQIGGILLATSVGISHAITNVPNAQSNFDFLLRMGSQNGLAISLSVLFTGVVVLGFIALLIKFKKGATLQDYLALHGFTGKQFLGFTAILLLLNGVIEFGSNWLGLTPMSFMDDIFPTAKPLWLLVLAMVIIAPIYEEVMFRGFMWAGLAKPLGFWWASIATSLVFAWIHGQYTPIEGVAIVALAMVFSWARAKSNSLGLPIVLHIMNNGLAMGLYLAGIK